jgi:hypothetical protein
MSIRAVLLLTMLYPIIGCVPGGGQSTDPQAHPVSDLGHSNDARPSPDLGLSNPPPDLSVIPDTGHDAGQPHDLGFIGTGRGEPCNPACSDATLCIDGRCEAQLTGVPALDAVLLGDPNRFDTELLISQDPDLSWRPSRIYKWRDFVQAVAVMYLTGVGEQRLWLGDPDIDDARRTRYALVNLAAFLAQSMKETIRYDACDENNWDNTNGYQISNACGQLGQDYSSYDCEFACPRDPTMAISATTNAAWYGAPGPFFCAPDATLREAGLLTAGGRTGRWDHATDCWPYPATEPDFSPADGPAWSRPVCEVYAGQKGGQWVWDGSGGSVEGCCWWGRGVIQTTGRCNFGRLNHYLGQSHLNPGEHPAPVQVLYPEVNFCHDPGVICDSPDHPELKWVAGLFYWMNSVQSYDEDGWQYTAELRAWVDGGQRGTAFIDAVSGIVNRGCHTPPCATGPVDGLEDRRANFNAVLEVMGVRAAE